MNNWIVIAICLFLVAGICIKITHKEAPALWDESDDPAKADKLMIGIDSGIRRDWTSVSIFDASSGKWKDLGEASVTIGGRISDEDYHKIISEYFWNRLSDNDEPLPPEFEDWLNNREEEA